MVLFPKVYERFLSLPHQVLTSVPGIGRRGQEVCWRWGGGARRRGDWGRSQGLYSHNWSLCLQELIRKSRRLQEHFWPRACSCKYLSLEPISVEELDAICKLVINSYMPWTSHKGLLNQTVFSWASWTVTTSEWMLDILTSHLWVQNYKAACERSPNLLQRCSKIVFIFSSPVIFFFAMQCIILVCFKKMKYWNISAKDIKLKNNCNSLICSFLKLSPNYLCLLFWDQLNWI